MEKKTPSPFKRDIDRAYKRLQLASGARKCQRSIRHGRFEGSLSERFRVRIPRGTAHAARKVASCFDRIARRKAEDGAPDQRGAAASHRLYRRGLVRRRYACASAKKEHGGAEYIRHSLYLALGEYFKCHEKLRIDNCVLTVCHRYDKSRPEREYRDHAQHRTERHHRCACPVCYTVTLRFAVNTTIARLRTTGTQQRYCSFRNLNSLSAMSASKPTRKRCFHCSLNTQNAEKTYAFRGRKRPF